MPPLSPLSALASDSALRALLEAGGVWLWDHDLTTETTVYQQGFWEQYGYTEQQLAETFDFLRVVHSRDLREMTKAWRAHLDGETPIYESQWRLRTAAGEWRWIQSRGQVVERDPAGKPLRMVGAYNDITSVKRSEDDLAASNAELDAVFRSSRDGLALVSTDLTLLRANDAAVALISRFTGGDIFEGEDIREIPAFSEDRPVLGDILATLATGAERPPRTVASPAGAGWLELSYSPVHDAAGSILGVAVTLRDTTEKVRAEHASLQTMRLETMGLLAGGIAHDFNNLLGAVVGNLDLAMLTAADDETRLSLQEARQATRRASELVQQLLAFAGKTQTTVAPLDFSRLVREIARYAGKIPGNRVAIREHLPAGLPELRGDPTQLRQMVLNLLVNALDATSEHGTAVTVRAWTVNDPREAAQDFVMSGRSAASYIVLEVADDGAGMDAETRARIFDPFFTTKATGHGLGLASVLGAVRSHGGWLSVRSEPGAGSAFTVFLPVDL